MTSYSRWYCLLFLTATVQPGVARAAESVAAFAMKASEFRGLSPEDQKTLLASAFARRLELAKNIQYEAVLTGQNHEYRAGKIGKLVVKLNGSRLRHWKIGESFRVDTIRGGDMSIEPLPVESVASGFDPKAGVGTSTIHFSNTARCFGRIDVSPDPINDSNRYAYWLDGKDTPEQEFFIRYIVEHRKDFEVDASVEGESIRLTLPWKPYWSEKVIGKRSFDLDPHKGFLPVRGDARWEMPDQDGNLSWRNEEFFVENSKLVVDVYMPTRYKELLSASTLGDGLVTVWQTDVSKVEAGNVTPKDLEVPLTEGMEVVDAIKGVFYKVGPDGKPTGKVDRLVGAKSHFGSPGVRDGSAEGGRFMFMITNLGVIIIVGTLAVWRFNHKRPTNERGR